MEARPSSGGNSVAAESAPISHRRGEFVTEVPCERACPRSRLAWPSRCRVFLPDYQGRVPVALRFFLDRVLKNRVRLAPVVPTARDPQNGQEMPWSFMIRSISLNSRNHVFGVLRDRLPAENG